MAMPPLTPSPCSVKLMRRHQKTSTGAACRAFYAYEPHQCLSFAYEVSLFTFAKLVIDQCDHRFHCICLVNALGFKFQLRPLTRREHHDAHD